MDFTQPSATFFIPDHSPLPEALERVTHMGVGAHQDDLEFMALHGIMACYGRAVPGFCGVTCTDGGGSARTGPYAQHTDAEMQAVRRAEQNRAAEVGRYAAMFQLAHPSSVVKDPHDTRLSSDLFTILSACRPQIIYTHNPADKHDTHLGVLVSLIETLRALPPDRRPAAVHGCEVWRDLDWLGDAEKIVHDLTGGEALEAELAAIFQSQIAGGKRYDLAVAGRHRANATMLNSHATDQLTAAAFALDLTPLIRDPGLDILDFTMSHLERFAADVRTRLGRRLGR